MHQVESAAPTSLSFPMSKPVWPVLASCLAALLILVSLGSMFSSSWDDSPCWDEPQHVTAGYLYLTAQSFQINCWHPPLVKDIAAIPLLFMHLKSPLYTPECKRCIWNATRMFFFHMGHQTQSIIRCARAPLIVLAALFCLIYYLTLRRQYGQATALVALLMLSASPSFLAHARFVTNDVPAAAAFFVCLTQFVGFLKNPSLRSLILVAVLTGIAQLVKFSLLMLYPFYLLVGMIWIPLSARGLDWPSGKEALKKIGQLTAQLAVMALTAVAIISIVYQLHILNMPLKFQQSYNAGLFDYRFDSPVPQLILWTQELPFWRGFSWFLTGLFAQAFHLQAGHGTPAYLLGTFYADSGNPIYFPVLLLTKEPLAFLLLFNLAILIGLHSLIRSRIGPRLSFRQSSRAEFLAVTSALFVLVYLLLAMASNLNIGVRHILPIFPFLYLLTARSCVHGIKLGHGLERKVVLVLVAALLSWGFLSSELSWPGYLAYFNELAGGKANGACVAMDSNYDWGTDLLRLKQYLERNNISKVYLLYFGKCEPYYYLGDRFQALSLPSKPPPGELMAVSMMCWKKIEIDCKSPPMPNSPPEDAQVLPPRYDPKAIRWFCSLKPIGRAGDSILLFRVP